MADRAAHGRNTAGIPRAWLHLLAAIGTEVLATLSLKGALDNPLLYVVVVGGYAAAFFFLSRVLHAGLSVGVAYGVWGACGVALTAVFSHLIFGEPLTGVMVLGIVVLVIGVLLVELGGRKADAR